MRPFLAILGGAWMLLTLGVTPLKSDAPALKESSPPVKSALDEVISQQIAAFHAGDFARAYTFAAKEIQGLYDPAKFEQMVRAGFPLLTQSTSTEFGPALDDGENGISYARVTGPSGTQLYRYALKHEAAGWKIIGVDRQEEDAPGASPASPPSPEPPSPPKQPPNMA